MSGDRNYEIDPVVFAQARRIGLIGNVEKRLVRMARQSAPFTHPEGNRRFESFILRIEKGVVKSIRKFNPQTGEVIHDVLGKLEERTRMLRAIEKHLGEPAERPAGDAAPAPQRKPPVPKWRRSGER